MGAIWQQVSKAASSRYGVRLQFTADSKVLAAAGQGEKLAMWQIPDGTAIKVPNVAALALAANPAKAQFLVIDQRTATLYNEWCKSQ